MDRGDKTELVKDSEWDKYRDVEGYIDILEMYRSKNRNVIPECIVSPGMNYLNSIMILQPIRSRQAAALAVATAAFFDSHMIDK